MDPTLNSKAEEQSSAENHVVNLHSCKTPFVELKLIKFCEMTTPMVYIGRYLVCKVIRMPSKDNADALLQDLNGDNKECSIHIFRFEDVGCISVGTILIIMEPFLKNQLKDKSQYLWIDSPSDVIFVDPTDSEFMDKIGATQWYESASKDSEYWREKANECFKKGKFEDALKLYDRAIRYNSELAVLYLNKSLTCLKIEAFYAAYESAKIACEKVGDKEKALYRMGLAAYGMREWQKAAKRFAELLKEFPQNTTAEEKHRDANFRWSEQKHGTFDFKNMHIESKKEKSKIDVADYAGPIEIADIPGKGRGIIASENIKAGTLIVVSKAFSSGYSQDFPGSLNGLTPQQASQALQFNKTMMKLQKNPQKAKELYQLFAGDMDTSEEIPKGIIDADRLHRISELNRFGWDGVAKDRRSKTYQCHLFILPSYFNHACIANAYHIFNGDYMIVHAITDIKKGEEICLSYLSFAYLIPYSARKILISSWKFTCSCKLCEIDSKDELCSKRAKMFAEFTEYAQRNPPINVIVKGEELLGKIRETYVKRNEFQIILVELLKLLYRFYEAVKDLIKSRKCLEEVIEIVNNSDRYDVDLAPMTYDFARYFHDPDTPEYDELVKKAFELSFCDDMEHFKMFYSI
uniref:SET domain-containing protein n=1 Tax=Panagrolaimus sp. ES5 TaxID=591445 RepID=A0AC34FKY4_9BILA